MQTHTHIPDVSSLQLCFFFRRLVHTLSFPPVLVPHVWLISVHTYPLLPSLLTLFHLL